MWVLCAKTNTLLASKGKVPISIFDIHSFPRLPLFESLYDEVVPIQWELANKLPQSCAYLFVVYQKLIQGCMRKLTIKQWITFWFRGSNKYHVFKKSDKRNQPLSQGYCSLSSIQRLCEWNDFQATFDELQVAKSQCTETFLTILISCWLCTSILLVRDVDCICPSTIKIALIMASSIGVASLPPSLWASKRHSKRSFVLHILLEVRTVFLPTSFMHGGKKTLIQV